MLDELPVLQDALTDRSARRIRYLRVSVTDRCNYACAYCMPVGGWGKVPKDHLLSLDELFDVVSLMADLGVERVRITGGEPLLRRGVPALVGRINALSGVREVVMTTNGHLLDRYASDLAAAGVTGMNVSLDTFDPTLFHTMTRGGDLERVLCGIAAAERAGISTIKINAVVVGGVNDDRVAEVAEGCWSRGWVPRFIELMPIGDLPYTKAAFVVPTDAIVDRIAARHPLRPVGRDVGPAPRGPAEYHVVTAGPFAGRRVGLISPMSDDGFCGACNRARLTARGGFRPCLADDGGEVSILQPLRAGASRDELVDLIRSAVQGKRPAHRMNEPELVPLTGMTGMGG